MLNGKINQQSPLLYPEDQFREHLIGPKDTQIQDSESADESSGLNIQNGGGTKRSD